LLNSRWTSGFLDFLAVTTPTGFTILARLYVAPAITVTIRCLLLNFNFNLINNFYMFCLCLYLYLYLCI
jgi:hypothetical protein